MCDPVNDPKFENELLRLSDLGQKALERHDIRKAFDYLFTPALRDHRPHWHFLTIPNTTTRMYLLSKKQIERLKESADQHYSLHQYTYGRYLQLIQPYEGATEEAGRRFEAAAKGGTPDALCALAYLIKNGHYGPVDLKRYKELIDQAFQENSMLAKKHVYHNMIYGQEGEEANPQYVIDAIKKYEEHFIPEARESLFSVDPAYYEIMGDAYFELGDMENAENYYKKAIRMGHYEAYYRYCLMYVDSQDKTLQEKYRRLLDEGCSHGIAGCYFFRALYFGDRIEEYDKEAKKGITAAIKSDLKTAAQLGDNYAPSTLGRAYYYGQYGFRRHNRCAWNWFKEGMRREDVDAFVMAAEMIWYHDQPEDVPFEYIYLCELNAVRRGDEEKLYALMDAYYHGKLDFAKDEIYKYYIPRYEKAAKEFHERLMKGKERPEDPNAPSMKLIAIIKPNGKANIVEFDMEHWDELAPMIDAERLDAIRTQPLYDLSDKMGYTNKHITAWVDDRGLLRGLPTNRIGCKLYPGPIVGDLILTLEDNNYEPMSFSNREELEKILTKLGAEIL